MLPYGRSDIFLITVLNVCRKVWLIWCRVDICSRSLIGFEDCSVQWGSIVAEALACYCLFHRYGYISAGMFWTGSVLFGSAVLKAES